MTSDMWRHSDRYYKIIFNNTAVHIPVCLSNFFVIVKKEGIPAMARSDEIILRSFIAQKTSNADIR